MKMMLVVLILFLGGLVAVDCTFMACRYTSNAGSSLARLLP